MPADQLVQARIDGAIKEEGAAVLGAMGLTVSDAVRLLLTRIAREHALPFDPPIPNVTTVAAMREARKGGLPRFASAQALMDDLHAEDCAPASSSATTSERPEARGQHEATLGADVIGAHLPKNRQRHRRARPPWVAQRIEFVSERRARLGGADIAQAVKLATFIEG